MIQIDAFTVQTLRGLTDSIGVKLRQTRYHADFTAPLPGYPYSREMLFGFLDDAVSYQARLENLLVEIGNLPAGTPAEICKPEEGFAYHGIGDDGSVLWRCRKCGGLQRTPSSDVPTDHVKTPLGPVTA